MSQVTKYDKFLMVTGLTTLFTIGIIGTLIAVGLAMHKIVVTYTP